MEFSVKKPFKLTDLIIYILVYSFSSLLFMLNYFENLMTGGVVLVLLSITLLTIVLHNIVIEDSLLLIPSLGFQISQKTALGTRKAIRFIPLVRIKSLIINETIMRQHVISYLAFTLDAPDVSGHLLIPLFSGTLPRLNKLIDMYKQISKCIK